jgi:hypothetical protein
MKLSKSFSAICLLLLSAFAMPAAVTNVELARVHTAAQVALNGGTNGCAVSGASVTTGTTPSVITCVAAHNLVTGDQVQITGIVGTTTDNVTAWVTVLSATTFAIYNNVNMQSTQGIIGTGTYSSGGYVTEATDVSALTMPYTIVLRVTSTGAANILAGGASAVIYLQSATDGFVAGGNTQTLAVIPIVGGAGGGEITKTWRDFSVPQSAVGVTNGRLRLLVESIVSGGSITTSLLVQN